MFQLPDDATVEVLLRDLDGIKSFALHKFAGPEDPFIKHLDAAIEELEKLPRQTKGLIIED